MLRFLDAIFAARNKDSGNLSRALLDAAVERAVDRTDPRLRALSSYRRHLREPVARAMRHVVRLAEQMPEAAEISPRRYGHDPRLRAVFASAAHLRDVLGRLQTLKDYLDERTGPPPDDVFGLLVMSQRRRRVLGMELDGDTLRRDVLQTAVSFSDHRYLAPADSERLTRRELRRQAFDFLLAKASARMAGEKCRRGDLARERQQLRRQIDAWQRTRERNGAGFRGHDESNQSLAVLEAEMARIDNELGRYRGSQLGLEESLDHLVCTLNRSDELLALRPIRVNLDHRGIERAGIAPSGAPPVEVIEISSSTGLRRIVLLGKIPRQELPRPRDAIKLGEAYLGSSSRGGVRD